MFEAAPLTEQALSPSTGSITDGLRRSFCAMLLLLHLGSLARCISCMRVVLMQFKTAADGKAAYSIQAAEECQGVSGESSEVKIHLRQRKTKNRMRRSLQA